MSEPSPSELPRQKLDHLRTALLRLHKAIIDSERVEYAAVTSRSLVRLAKAVV